MKKAHWKDTFLVVGIVGLVRLVYLLSAPFVMEGDGNHYFRYMMEPFRSNLLHASGYPFLLHFTGPLSQFLHVGRFEVLRTVQQLIPIAACAFLHRGLTSVTSRWAAFLAAVLVGTNFFSVSEAGNSMPEFLLESWLLCFLALLVAAGANDNLRTKQTFYLLAGPLFACGYLIKYNFVGYATLFALLLLDRALPVVRRLALLVTTGALGAGVVVLYIVFFHQPTTGSYALNLEHGWVHLFKLHRAGFVPKPEYGPATQKFLILAKLLPEAKECCSQNFLKLDSIPDAVREPYRRNEGKILTLTDPLKIQRLYDEFGSPTTVYANFQQLYYYLGLPETEALLTKVFQEAVIAEPRAYLADVALHVREGLLEKHTRYLVRVPVPEAPYPLSRLYLNPAQCHVLHPAPGTRFVESSSLSCSGAYYFGPRRFWIPGLWFSMVFALPHLLPIWLFWPIVLLGAFAAFPGRKELPGRFHLISLLSLFGFAVFSSVLYQIRQKELLILEPFFVLVFVLGLDQMVRAVKLWSVPWIHLADSSASMSD